MGYYEYKQYVKKSMQRVEMPELDCMKIQELLLDLTINPEIRYISRKNIIQYLQEHPEYLAD